jgi:hypothetical protein
MLANARPATRARSGQTAADLAGSDYSSTADRITGYLAIIRGGVFERHIRGCARCQPGGPMAETYGPCRTGLYLARRADEALAAFEASSPSDPVQAAAPGALW